MCAIFSRFYVAYKKCFHFLQLHIPVTNGKMSNHKYEPKLCHKKFDGNKCELKNITKIECLVLGLHIPFHSEMRLKNVHNFFVVPRSYFKLSLCSFRSLPLLIDTPSEAKKKKINPQKSTKVIFHMRKYSHMHTKKKPFIMRVNMILEWRFVQQ